MAKSNRREYDSISVPKSHLRKQKRQKLTKSLREVAYTFETEEDLDEFYSDLLDDDLNEYKRQTSN